MSFLFDFLGSFFAADPSAGSSADEAYLGEAVDLYDLERRMRVIDDRRRSALAGIAHGLYPR
jgi:hypothetical protein